MAQTTEQTVYEEAVKTARDGCEAEGFSPFEVDVRKGLTSLMGSNTVQGYGITIVNGEELPAVYLSDGSRIVPKKEGRSGCDCFEGYLERVDLSGNRVGRIQIDDYFCCNV